MGQVQDALLWPHVTSQQPRKGEDDPSLVQPVHIPILL